MTSEAFALEYVAHVQSTQKFVARMGAHRDVVEDVTQAAWTKAWEHREQHDGRSTFSTWVCAIARNEFLDRLRKLKARPEVEMPVSYEPSYLTDLDLPILTGEILSICRKVADRVILIRLAEGYTSPEIGTMLGDSSGSVKLKAMRSRRHLRNVASKFPLKQRLRA